MISQQELLREQIEERGGGLDLEDKWGQSFELKSQAWMNKEKNLDPKKGSDVLELMDQALWNDYGSKG